MIKYVFTYTAYYATLKGLQTATWESNISYDGKGSREKAVHRLPKVTKWNLVCVTRTVNKH